MADYYTQTSSAIAGFDSARTKLLDQISLYTSENDQPPIVVLDHADALQCCCADAYSLGFCYEAEADGSLWVYEEMAFEPEIALATLHYVMWAATHDLEGAALPAQKLPDTDAQTITWANTCSKPRIDGFSGGKATLTKHKIVWE